MKIHNLVTAAVIGFLSLMASASSANAYEVKFINSSDGAFAAIERQQYDEAIEQLKAKIAKKSEKMDVQLANLCTALVVSNRLDEAANTCDRAVEVRGRYLGTALNSRGVMKIARGDFEGALEDFSLAADASSHPELPHHALWSRVPGMPNRSTPNSTFHEVAAVAQQNYAKADKRWAAIKAKEAELLKAAVIDE